MEFGRPPKSGLSILVGIIFIMIVIVGGVIGVWYVWENFLSEGFGEVLEFLGIS